MEKILSIITKQVQEAFESAGYPSGNVRATVSNRPDLCEYQCNDAMALAKVLHKAPMAIAGDVAAELEGNPFFERVEAAAPGFINLTLSGDFIAGYINSMRKEEKFGLEVPERVRSIIVDYGGPNVAKPLHIGHLRSAIIGESIKRICLYMGHKALGDIHLGDWGLQMGQIIAELNLRQPDLPYFDENFDGDYPGEAPFTISRLEEIYPTASGRCKTDEAFYNKAKEATAQLQQGRRGYLAIWKHVLDVSVNDLKKNYEKLNVHFELWKGESDVQKYIPGMIERMEKDGFLRESEGAKVIDVAREDDKKEIPPCIIVKSDGATLYSTTDLATILERVELFNPDYMIYVVDKRQGMHFEQVFRAAKKTGIVGDDTDMFFLGFGTMNGTDGQPFKTRQGGVMRLETLIDEIRQAVYEKMQENGEAAGEESENNAQIIALAALKYGDLSNQATKDYIFDVKRFIEFEGNTGPYILYTIVRIKSILAKYGKEPVRDIFFSKECTEKQLMLKLSGFTQMLEEAYVELAPHKICAYIHELANALNTFYHEVKILSCEDEDKKDSYVSLLALTKEVLETCIDLLGFSAPERM
ncbi:MAG: arginine--tRNA ligase [Lachnospiraceae bacterium]|jgi:arginyl-tRNA synthetase